ncbi:TolC family protein [Polyangium mundeleinium]|uniref:TolC family protein n=1 Tax=Polyangium mundeleinium TaxID=2995306 RepID=A0ABT5EL03_9BACT|nr:TolC family protein [Polyangium mundeleinium]MDC0742520.1 TolC family protein [Polyangium mundeleinium]
MTSSRVFGGFSVLLVSLAAAGCGHGALDADVRDVNEFLAAQGAGRTPGGAARPSTTLPSEERWEEDPAEAPRILAKPLHAEAAVRLSLLLNRDLRASMYELGIARGRVVTAGLLPNPEVEVSLRAPQDPFQTLQADIGIEYDISRVILLPLRKGAAEAELAAERVRVAGQVLDTGYRARVAFYEVQARQGVLDLRARALAAYQAGYAAAEELHRVGNLPDVDLATQRAAVEASRIEVAEAENALLDARERLNLAIGLSGEQTSWTAPDPLPPPEVDTIDANGEKKALAASFELAEIAGRMQAAGKRVGVARAEGSLPHLSGGFHSEHDGRSWEIGGHVTVGLPIFDRAQGRVISAESELGVLRERYVATATTVRASLRMAQNRVESAGKRAKHFREVLIPAREKALAETILQYNAMQVGVFQVLEMQRRVTDTGIAYTETLLEYWKARAALEQILAGRHRSVGLAAPGVGSLGNGAADVGAGQDH